MAVTIYDWRNTIAPHVQFFHAGGQSMAGGMTLGGARFSSPEPGGRGVLSLSFPHSAGSVSSTDASWTIARIRNGSVMRFRLFETSQLVRAADLSGPVDGVPWSNDEPWANGKNWAWNPTAPVAVAAAKGAENVAVDLSDWGQVLRIGHVIGFSVDGYDYAHEIMDIDCDSDDIATLNVSPPIRRALTTDHAMTFRPKMLVTCQNPDAAFAGYAVGEYIKIGDLRFVEFLV